MSEMILTVDWTLFMHGEKKNHLEQEVFQNRQNRPSLLNSQLALIGSQKGHTQKNTL